METYDWNNRPEPGFVDPVTGWIHRSIGLWDHPALNTYEWGDMSVGAKIADTYIADTAPCCNPTAPQDLLSAVLWLHRHHDVPLAGQLASPDTDTWLPVWECRRGPVVPAGRRFARRDARGTTNHGEIVAHSVPTCVDFEHPTEEACGVRMWHDGSCGEHVAHVCIAPADATADWQPPPFPGDEVAPEDLVPGRSYRMEGYRRSTLATIGAYSADCGWRGFPDRAGTPALVCNQGSSWSDLDWFVSNGARFYATDMRGPPLPHRAHDGTPLVVMPDAPGDVAPDTEAPACTSAPPPAPVWEWVRFDECIAGDVVVIDGRIGHIDSDGDINLKHGGYFNAVDIACGYHVARLNLDALPDPLPRPCTAADMEEGALVACLVPQRDEPVGAHGVVCRTAEDDPNAFVVACWWPGGDPDLPDELFAEVQPHHVTLRNPSRPAATAD